ncbi:MAG TPA: hypothetical protein VGH04_06365 [Gemmatimonadaceae bacterium]
MALPAALAAQQEPLTYPELRADAFFANGTTVQGGAGIVVPAGVYVRVGLDGGAGESWRDGSSFASGRVDLIARFLLDPLRENNIAFSFGGGLSEAIDRAGFRTPYLTIVMDVEGRRRGGFTPAIEVGLGGGARVGFVLRRSSPRWR